MLHAFVGLVKVEGVLALYRGLLPSMLLVAPQIGAVFAFYRAFSDLWEQTGNTIYYTFI